MGSSLPEPSAMNDPGMIGAALAAVIVLVVALAAAGALVGRALAVARVVLAARVAAVSIACPPKWSVPARVS